MLTPKKTPTVANHMSDIGHNISEYWPYRPITAIDNTASAGFRWESHKGHSPGMHCHKISAISVLIKVDTHDSAQRVRPTKTITSQDSIINWPIRQCIN